MPWGSWSSGEASESIPLISPKGGYNANTNTPMVVNGTGTLGDWYIVTTAGNNNPTGLSMPVNVVLAYDGNLWSNQGYVGSSDIIALSTHYQTITGQSLSIGMPLTIALGVLVGNSIANQPMTTLGDMIIGGIAGVPTRLAGNGAATIKYLQSTGTGSAATEPTWQAFTNTLGSSVNTLTSVSNGISATASIINSILNTYDGNNLITVINGLSSSGIQIDGQTILGFDYVNGTMTNSVSLNTSQNNIYNLIQSLANGTQWKAQCLAGAVVNVNIAAPSSAVFDMVTVPTGGRVYLSPIYQTTTSQCGIWVFNGVSVPMSRPSDYNAWSEVYGAVIPIAAGGVIFGETVWRNSNGSTGTIDVTAQTFIAWYQSVLPGTNIGIVNNVVSVFDSPVFAGIVTAPGFTGNSTSYNAATNTPALSSMVAGSQYLVTTAGRISGTVAGAICTSGGSFLCVGDIIQCTATSTYKLLNPIITTTPSTILIGTLLNASSIYFINLGETIAYLNQRRINAGQLFTVGFDTSYESISYANPDSGTLTWGHPDSNLIHFVGNSVGVTASANTANSGSLGNQSCTYTVAANSFVNNTWICLYGETINTTTGPLTQYAGSHSGCWQLTSGGGTTSLVLNNINSNSRVALPGGGDTNFLTATIATATNVKASLIVVSGTPASTFNHLIFITDTNGLILNIGADLNFLTLTSILGIASSTASAHTGMVAQFENCSIGGVSNAGSTNGSQYGVLALMGVKTNLANTAAFNTSLINVSNFIPPLAPLGFNTNIFATVFSGSWSAAGSTQINTALTCNIANALTGMNFSAGTIRMGVLVSNGNSRSVQANGATISIGTHYGNFNSQYGLFLLGCTTAIFSQTANSNTTAANYIEGGSLDITTQLSCVSNGIGNIVKSGNLYIGTQTSCINNTTADNYVQSGTIQIATDNSGASTATNHYSSDSGLILIQAGTNSIGTGLVTTIGVGQIVKTTGTSPFNITNLPVAVATKSVTVTAGAGTINCTLGNVFTSSIIANTTFTLSNMISGQVITLRVTSSGAFTVAFSPTLKWSGGTQPVQTSTGTDIYTIEYDGTNYYAVVSQGFA